MTIKDLIFELKKRCSFWLNNKTISKKHALECLFGILESVESLFSLPSDLDEAAEEYIDRFCFDCDIIGESRSLDAFKAGAEWMAERDKEKIEQAFFSGYDECEDRMKKEFEKRAMAGEVNNTGYPTTIQLHTFDSSLKNGDKVNIIIMKQEQK